MDRDNFESSRESRFSFDSDSDSDDDNLDQLREERRSKFDRKTAKMARRKEPRRKEKSFQRGGKEDRYADLDRPRGRY